LSLLYPTIMNIYLTCSSETVLRFICFEHGFEESCTSKVRHVRSHLRTEMI
jgi:hypothetical protein